MLVILDILANYLGSHLISNSTGEIADFPKLALPETHRAFDLWILLEPRGGGNTLEQADNPRNGPTRRKRHTQMHMVVGNFQRVDLDLMIRRDLPKKFPNPITDI